MAGSELTDLTPAVVGDLDDDTLFYIVADPAGSPADKSLALSVLRQRLTADLSATFEGLARSTAAGRLSRLRAWERGFAGSNQPWTATESGAAVTTVGAGTWSRTSLGIRVSGGGGAGGTPPAVARVAGTGGEVQAAASFRRRATLFDGFAFRVVDANNFFVAGINSARSVEVGQWVGGVYTQLAQAQVANFGDLRLSVLDVDAGCMRSNAGVWLWARCLGVQVIAEVTDSGVLGVLTDTTDSGLAIGHSNGRATDITWKSTEAAS